MHTLAFSLSFGAPAARRGVARQSAGSVRLGALHAPLQSGTALVGALSLCSPSQSAVGECSATRRLRRRSGPAHAVAVAAASDKKVNVLVVGGGGREHSLCWRLRKSDTCGDLYCSPGNAGIAREPGVKTPSLSITDHQAVIKFCKDNGVGLAVIGPEAPLVDGLADSLTAAGIPCFGPSKKAAQLEGSKGFMKDLCARYNVPTAAYKRFTDLAQAKDYIRAQGAPIVVKADGLAAGKGVVVAQSVEEALEAAEGMLIGGSFGAAGSSIVVEAFLSGEEASFFALVDGETAVPLVACQDHKAVGDGDTGPNTGGMGAYSPAPVVTPAIVDQVMREMIQPTVDALKQEGMPFVGVLFAGLMVEGGRAQLLEYNVRFGDPECQALMVRLQSDLVQVLLAACTGGLKGARLEWSSDPAVVVVVAAKGYPGEFARGEPIRGLEDAAAQGAIVFHAGTATGSDGDVVSNGGRVLGVTATGKTTSEAAATAYKGVDAIKWPGGFSRRDIAYRAIAREKEGSA